MGMTAAELTEISRVRLLAERGDARRIRESARLSLGELAAVLDVPAVNVGRWERGERAPRGEQALRYGDLLGRLAKAAGTEPPGPEGDRE
jgi:DNA-binding transcriptional regulator YiaG